MTETPITPEDPDIPDAPPPPGDGEPEIDDQPLGVPEDLDPDEAPLPGAAGVRAAAGRLDERRGEHDAAGEHQGAEHGEREGAGRCAGGSSAGRAGERARVDVRRLRHRRTDEPRALARSTARRTSRSLRDSS